jgi:hypothetical protein
VPEHQHKYARGGDPGTDAGESVPDQVLTAGAQPRKQRARRDHEYQRARVFAAFDGLIVDLP